MRLTIYIKLRRKGMSKCFRVQIQATVSYDFEVEVDADDMGEAEAIADTEYWNDQYHREARASQLHDEFEIVNVEEIILDDGSLDDDDDYPPRED
jgi:hypothetical protein